SLAIRSAKLIPAAATSINTSPVCGCGSGRCWTWSTSGPPWPVITTARICRKLQADGPPRDEPLAGNDLVDHLARHRDVGRDRHRGQPPVAGALLLGLAAD